MPEDQRRCRAALVIARCERATDQRARAEHVEQVAGRENHGDGLAARPVRPHRGLDRGRHGRESRERPGVLPKLAILRVRRLDGKARRARALAPDEEQLVRVLERQRTEEHGVDDGEHCRRGADT
jgi:hypothetical protein